MILTDAHKEVLKFLKPSTHNVVSTGTNIAKMWLSLFSVGCVRLAWFAVESRGEGALPYMGYIGMCRCEGYGFQAV